MGLVGVCYVMGGVGKVGVGGVSGLIGEMRMLKGGLEDGDRLEGGWRVMGCRSMVIRGV